MNETMARARPEQETPASGVRRAAQSPGRALDPQVRRLAEEVTGESLETVRVHSGSAAVQSARALGARAYTSGEHITVDGSQDRETMLEESIHVVQQRRGPVSGTAHGDIHLSHPDDPHEREASRLAAAADRGTPVSMSPGPNHGPFAHRSVQRSALAEFENGTGRGTVLHEQVHLVHRHGPVNRTDQVSVQRATNETSTAPAPPSSSSGMTGALRDVSTPLTADSPGLRACDTGERALSVRYGVRIGPGPDDTDPKHFSSAMLTRIDTALGQLPRADLSENGSLVALEMDPAATGDASAYHFDTGKIGFVVPRLRVGVRIPSWLYSVLSMDKPVLRSRMDRGALRGYPGVDDANDRSIGIDPDSRHVMSAQGNLVEWTVRHEVGHPVARETGWLETVSGEERFGGWKVHVSAAERTPIAEAVLRKARLLDVLTAERADTHLGTLTALLAARGIRDMVDGGPLDAYFERFRDRLTPTDFVERTSTAIRLIRLMIAQAWTLPDDEVAQLADGDRVYHLSSQDTWVSHSLRQRRTYQLSRYQFSDPDEWFAEVYAAYYNATKPEERNKIHPGAQQWLRDREARSADQSAG